MCESLGDKPTGVMKVKGYEPIWAQYRPVLILLMDLSKSICAGTRKMVNYAWIG
jgi:hypothetical protein